MGVHPAHGAVSSRAELHRSLDSGLARHTGKQLSGSPVVITAYAGTFPPVGFPTVAGEPPDSKHVQAILFSKAGQLWVAKGDAETCDRAHGWGLFIGRVDKNQDSAHKDACNLRYLLCCMAGLKSGTG